MSSCSSNGRQTVRPNECVVKTSSKTRGPNNRCSMWRGSFPDLVRSLILTARMRTRIIPQAFVGNDIVALNYIDGSALFQSPVPSEESPYKKNAEMLPPLGTSVKVTIEVNSKMQRYILISGKVQGVWISLFH